MKPSHPFTEADASALLVSRGIQPTSQRVTITRVLFQRCEHMSAEDVYREVNACDQLVSKATVYNTLGLLAEKGVVREVIANPSKVFYDPNTAPHHHFYDEETGALTDIDAKDVHVVGLPPLPPGADLQGVDVIVRLRHAK
ncbi:MAG: Fur family transcriptional regulator [Gammaproteobacteria bacterium]